MNSMEQWAVPSPPAKALFHHTTEYQVSTLAVNWFGLEKENIFSPLSSTGKVQRHVS